LIRLSDFAKVVEEWGMEVQDETMGCKHEIESEYGMIVNFKMEVKTWLNSLLQMVTFVKKARRLRVSQGDTR